MSGRRCLRTARAPGAQALIARSAQPPSVTGRVAAILLTVSEHPAQSLTEITRRTRLPRSTAHRLLAALVDGQLLRRDDDGRYWIRTIGGEPVVSGERAVAARRQVSAVLDDLVAATGLRARFGVWHDLGVTYLERAVGAAHASPTTGLSVLPAHATALGKAILAHAPSGVVDDVMTRRLPAFTPFTRTTAWELRRDLAAVRFSGFAVSRQEWREGEYAVATPVFGPGGSVIGALDLVVEDLEDRLRELRIALAMATRVLSRQLAADPRALPCGSDAAPLEWRADPTSAALVWEMEAG